jgi:heme O synthase-like polyprenyltransferase
MEHIVFLCCVFVWLISGLFILSIADELEYYDFKFQMLCVVITPIIMFVVLLRFVFYFLGITEE